MTAKHSLNPQAITSSTNDTADADHEATLSARPLSMEGVRNKQNYELLISSALSDMHQKSGGDVVDSSNKTNEMLGFGKVSFWVDYFNNMKKCWEPLLQRVIANITMEEVCRRRCDYVVKQVFAV